LSAFVNKNTKVGLTVTNQSAKNWNAAAAMLSASIAF